MEIAAERDPSAAVLVDWEIDPPPPVLTPKYQGVSHVVPVDSNDPFEMSSPVAPCAAPDGRTAAETIATVRSAAARRDPPFIARLASVRGPSAEPLRLGRGHALTTSSGNVRRMVRACTDAGEGRRAPFGASLGHRPRFVRLTTQKDGVVPHWRSRVGGPGP